MFKKLARIPDQQERLEVYNILKINFLFSVYLADFFSISMLISGLGWFFSNKISLLVNGFTGAFWLSSALSVLVMLIFILVIRLIPLCLRSQMQAAFGQDDRPSAKRFKQIMKANLKILFFAWLVCMPLFAFLVKTDLFIWTIITTVMVCLAVAVCSYYPFLLPVKKWRKLEKNELPSQVCEQVERWAAKSNIHVDDIVVNEDFSDHLSAPRLVGMGRKTKIAVDERALKEFSSQQLLVLFSSCVMASLVNAPLKVAVLRMCIAMALVPLSALLISTVGVSFWAYPMTYSPALASLFLLSAWLVNIMTLMAANLVKRSLSVQLGAAVCLLLKDDSILFSAMELMDEKNLNNRKYLGWRNLFNDSYGADDFKKRVQYQQHLASFEQREI